MENTVELANNNRIYHITTEAIKQLECHKNFAAAYDAFKNTILSESPFHTGMYITGCDILHAGWNRGNFY